MVKHCKICGNEIVKKDFVNKNTGRPLPKVKQNILYGLGYCYSCLQVYKQTQEIKKAVNNPKKRKEYEAKLKKKVEAGILTQEQMDAGLREVDEMFKK